MKTVAQFGAVPIRWCELLNNEIGSISLADEARPRE